VNTGFCWGDLRERGRLEDLGVDGRIILKWFSKKWMEVWTRLIWLRIEKVAGCCEFGYESSVFIQCREFLE
jgi:hypothetical protein